MSPFFSMHIATRGDIEETNPDAFGYAAATCVSYIVGITYFISEVNVCLRVQAISCYAWYDSSEDGS